MKIDTPSVSKDYPHLYNYVYRRVPKMSKLYPSRIEKFLAFCGNGGRDGRKYAEEALKKDTHPIVSVITDDLIRTWGLAHRKPFAGIFIPSRHAHRIWIYEPLAKKYQADAVSYGICLQYLLLHETVHWAKYHAGAADWAETPLGHGMTMDTGDKFERDVYGTNVTPYWHKSAVPTNLHDNVP